MERLGADVSSKDYWADEAADYAAAIDDAYHQHRLRVVYALLPSLAGKRVVDFGCGDGVVVRKAFELGAASVIGIDPEAGLLDLAKRDKGSFALGGVEQLAELEPASVDCIIATNVLAYLTDGENAAFYREARRIVRSGGHLVVTHSNDLFDLFTLNAYTVAFFKENFGVDPSPLLKYPDKPPTKTYNIRENPLAYPAKLRAAGFTVEQIEYINWHRAPPLSANQSEYADTLSAQDKWKLMFQCSTFGVRAIANE